MSLRSLFVTQIYAASLAGERDFAAFNAELDDACRMLADEDAAGQAWCEANAYAGYTSYASLDDLPRRASIFDLLKRKLDRHAATYAKALEFDLGRGRLRLDSLWANVLDPGGAHSGHIHPHSIISGTVYVAVPEGAAALRFEDPRLTQMMATPARKAGARKDHETFVSVAPAPGTLLLWESFIRHEVPINLGEDVRISVSFNYGY